MDKEFLQKYNKIKREEEVIKCKILNITENNLKKKTLKKKHILLKRRIKRKEIRINDYINNIDDCIIKKIATLRYLNGLKWSEVALKMGECYREDSLRIMFERYINKNNL